MAKAIQKKISIALNNKKRRTNESSQGGDWQEALEKSPFNVLIPTPESLNLDLNSNEYNQPEKLQIIFSRIIDILKRDFFNQENNKLKLENALESLFHEIDHATNNDQSSKLINEFYNKKTSLFAILYINTQISLAILFSKLAISVLSRSIKDKLGFPDNSADSDNIINLIDELINIAPDFTQDCKSWYQEQVNNYQQKPNEIENDEENDFLSDPLIEMSQELDEEALNELLTNEINKGSDPFSPVLIEYYLSSKPVTHLTIDSLTKKAIRKTYRDLHNFISKNHKILRVGSNDRLHQFCVEVINQHILQIDLIHSMPKSQVINLCKRQFRTQKSIIALSHEINEHRVNIKAFINELNLMPETSEVQHIKAFFNKKLESPIYHKIAKTLKRITQYEQYGTYKLFAVNILQYIKTLFTLPIYESTITTQIVLNNSGVARPLSIEDLNQIKAWVKKLEKYAYNTSIKRECSHLQHTLTFTEELFKQLDKIEALIKVDFSSIATYLINPLGNPEYTELVRKCNEETIASATLNDLLNNNQLSDMYINLINYQEQLRQLGRLRIESILKPEDSTINHGIDETYQKINVLYAKLYVIIDLIAVTSVVSSNNVSDDLKYIIDEMHNHLSEINTSFVSLSNTAQEFGYKKIDTADIFVLRITRGDFFTVKERDILSNASIAMLYSISPIALFNGLIEKFERYSTEQKQHCLLFVEDYLRFDTLQMLFSAINPEQSDFYSKLTTLLNLATQYNLSTKAIEALIKQSINNKSKRFESRITAIQNNELNKYQLIQRINTISNKLEINSYNLSKLDEYIDEISHIINSDNFSGFTQNEQSHLLSLFNKLEKQCGIVPAYKASFNKLRKNINYILIKKANKTHRTSKSRTQDPLKLKANLPEIISNTVENENNSSFYNKMIIRFINSIESEFANIFVHIDLSELRDLNWTIDAQRVANDLEPYAPHILDYHKHFELTVHFIKFIILYGVDTQKRPKQHSNLDQVKKIYQFIEKALIQALENKAITTAFIIYKALESKNIKRLKLASLSAERVYQEYFNKSNKNQSKIADLFREENVLPLLSFIQQKLLFTYKKSYGSQYERLSNIGISLKYFIDKKEYIKNIEYPQEHFFMQMKSFLLSLQVLDDNLKVDNAKIITLLSQASNNVKPDTSLKISLNDFKSISDLVKYLALCRSRMMFYQVNSENPDKDINDWLMKMIKSDDKLHYFTDFIESLFLLNDINQSFKRPYKRFSSDLVYGLTFYHKKVSSILKSEDESTRKNLDSFFSQYNKIKRLRDIKEMDESGFSIFSSTNKEKELLEKFDELYILFMKQQERFDKQRSQSAYTQLLEDVLSGNATKSPLTLPTENNSKKLTSIETLLPDNEYDIPSAEPEHPDRIGINRTMSFTAKEQVSVLDLFNTDELKAQFLASFPWARQIDNITKLNQANFADNSNLLGTPKVFSTELQLAVMRFVLIAMDSLGKIAGFNGDLTIQNFDRISDIINQLKWLSAELHRAQVNETQLLEQVDAVIREMGFRNQEYYEMQQLYNPPFNVEDNPNMNSFCHLNEHLAYQLSGADYDSTFLAPSMPDPSYLDQISQVLADNEKT